MLFGGVLIVAGLLGLAVFGTFAIAKLRELKPTRIAYLQQQRGIFMWLAVVFATFAGRQ